MVEKTKGFLDFDATKKLKSLAVSPIDLSKDDALTKERITHMQTEALGFKLLYATERVTDDVMVALESLAKEANVFAKMKAMQAGEVINKIEGFPSENRSVLHTAMRDFFDHPQTSEVASKAAILAKKEVDKLEKFLKKLDKDDHFTDLVQVGIGGSDLGPRALYIALQAYKNPKRCVHFVSNVDPDDVAATLLGLDLKKTLVVVVSKSGSTLETLTNEQLVADHFKKAGLEPKKHFIAVTGEKSPLDDPSKYLASFYMWDYIGGRYSATSMVGGVMLAFGLGFDNYKSLLKGAHAMDLVALKTDVKQNLPLLAALLGIWNRNFLGHQTVAVIPYSQALLRFTAHLQQCNMESNGKHIDKRGKPVGFDTGPIIWGEPGTNGQHSFYQHIHQGTTVVALEFIGFKESQYGQDLEVEETNSQQKLLANLFAQSIALAVGQKNSNPNKQFLGNRPNRILLAKKLDPYTLGALLSYFEHQVAFQGFIWNINSFDQEGVQLGKVLANKILDIFKKEKGAAAAFPIGQAMLDQLAKIK
ncbi:MAG: glucose-6-phosphate isomerase [Chlamydiales bacterium]|nr:glucose-6-phosphate isomerase [Chlamydiales bacterium]